MRIDHIYGNKIKDCPLWYKMKIDLNSVLL